MRLVSLTAALCALAAPALAQDVAPEDVIYGRQILMSEIEGQMGPIDLAAVGDDFDLPSSQVRASAISAMLGVVPFLFPEGTDAEAMADSDFPSTALPAIWQNFAAFRAMSDQSGALAFDLSQTADEAEFRQKSAELRALCNACHAAFMQPYESPY